MQFLTIPWYKGEEYFNTEITSRDELSKANEILKKAFSKFKAIISASSSAEIKDDVLYLDREDSGLTKKEIEKLYKNAFKKYGEQAGKVIAGQSSFCFDDEFVI